ncbi:MAG: ATP-binding protein [Coriobacteriia bacterium]
MSRTGARFSAPEPEILTCANTQRGISSREYQCDRPEGVSVRRVSIDAVSCDRSPGCPARRACPRGAIIPIAGGSYPGALGYTIDEERCTGCAICARYCPGGAVRTA